MKLLLVASLLIGAALAEDKMQDQCLCKDLNPCIEAGYENVETCANKCKKHFTDLGGDYEKASKCIHAHDDKIQKAIKCARASFGEVCTTKPGQMVPQRHHETLQLAAIRELTEMAKRSGLLNKGEELVKEAKAAVPCMIKCGQQSSCAKKLGCGVALPPDNEIVAKVKTCMLEAGFNTAVAKEVCGCIVDAGIKQLKEICPLIVVT